MYTYLLQDCSLYNVQGAAQLRGQIIKIQDNRLIPLTLFSTYLQIYFRKKLIGSSRKDTETVFN